MRQDSFSRQNSNNRDSTFSLFRLHMEASAKLEPPQGDEFSWCQCQCMLKSLMVCPIMLK